MSDVAEVKSRLDIVDVVGSYVQLQKAGASAMKARCPFHAEKTPSFYVSRDRQSWHCFGCGEGGDAIAFVMRMEGMGFRETLQTLADRAGVTLSDSKPEDRSEKRRVLDALALAARFYAAALKTLPQAQGARDYLARRGVSQEMIESFSLGFSPESWDALQTALGKRGVSAVDLEKAGLTIRRERGSGSYDRFRNRLVFPIRDVLGQVVGFTARTLDAESKEAKYINTPQTIVYNKSQAMYGIDRARDLMRREEHAILVEGNMDVIACHQIGMTNVVAVSGTALTEDQLRILTRYAKTISLAFDADAAGQTAAARGIDLAIAAGLTVRMIRIPEEGGKDPDECIKKDPELWRQAVKNAVHVMDFHIARLTKDKNISDPVVKRTVGNALLIEIVKIPDAIEQAHWVQKVASLIGVPDEALREQMKKLVTPRLQKSSAAQEEAAPVQEPKSRHRQLSEKLLAMLFAHPALVGDVVSTLDPMLLSDEEIRGLYNACVIGYTASRQFFAATDTLEGERLLRSLMMHGERDYLSLSHEDIAREVHTVLAHLHDVAHATRLDQLLAAMRRAEAQGDVQTMQTLEQEVATFMRTKRAT